jgi:D-arginine dehydrogenase
MTRKRCVVVGAGFAGAATAYYLARLGVDVVVLEQEPSPGVHASGRNAAMVRQVVPDREVALLTQAGAAFIGRPPDGWRKRVEFERNGSLLLGKGDVWEKLRKDAAMAREIGVEAVELRPEETRKRVAPLGDADFEGAIWCPTDGVVDIKALLAGYLEDAVDHGAEVRYESPFRGLEIRRGRVSAVATTREVIPAECVVNAAGAWAGIVAGLAGAAELGLRSCRRHLFVTPPQPWVDPAWPFVWDVSHDLYFRPESGGLLLCPCDQDEVAPGDPPLDPKMAEILSEKVTRHMPGLGSLSIHRSWAGLRTLSKDGRFVIGWDPFVAGFFWIAGLGGHGVTASAPVGALAARLIAGEEEHGPEEFSPARFARDSRGDR